MLSRSVLSGLAITAILMSAPLAMAEDVAKPVATGATTTQEGFLMSESQKDAIRELVGEYIRNHPQDIIDAVESHAAKQAKEDGATESKLTTAPKNLLDDPLTPFMGNKDGDVKIVEFFDYNCGFCKRATADLMRVVKEDAKVKVLFKELPILSDSSEVAARYALAANKQGKYTPMHNKLMEHSGAIDESVIKAYAKDLSLDFDQLKKDSQSQDTTDALNNNIELARTMNVRGTPFFVIGDQKVPGAVGYTRLKQLVDEARSAKPAVE